jgi:flagellar basal body-associated protein FliL
VRRKNPRKETTMRKRTMIVVIAIAVLGVLAISSTAAAMTWNHTNLVGNGYGYSGMMNGQQGYRGMMGRYQQGAPVTGVTSFTIQNFMYQPGAK